MVVHERPLVAMEVRGRFRLGSSNKNWDFQIRKVLLFQPVHNNPFEIGIWGFHTF